MKLENIDSPQIRHIVSCVDRDVSGWSSISVNISELTADKSTKVQIGIVNEIILLSGFRMRTKRVNKSSGEVVDVFEPMTQLNDYSFVTTRDQLAITCNLSTWFWRGSYSNLPTDSWEALLQLECDPECFGYMLGGSIADAPRPLKSLLFRALD